MTTVFFFDYLRLKARDAVLAGVQDALDQIDPALAGQVGPSGPETPAAGDTAVPRLGPAAGSTPAPPATPTVPSVDSPGPPAPPAPTPAAGSLQERLAQANTALGTNPPTTPPKPSSPKRGRGRPDDGGTP